LQLVRSFVGPLSFLGQYEYTEERYIFNPFVN